MKRVLKKIFLILLILTVFNLAFLAFSRGQLSVYLEIPDGAREQNIEFEPENIVSVSKIETLANGYECLHLKVLQSGETSAIISWDGMDEDSLYDSRISLPFSVNAQGILIDQNSLSFSGWYGIYFSFTAFTLVLSILLFIEFQKRSKKSLYSHTNVACLAFSIFFFLLGIQDLYEFILLFIHPESKTLYRLIIDACVMTRRFMLIASPVVILFSIALCISNIVLCRHEGRYLSNMLGLFAGILILIGTAAGLWICLGDEIFALKNTICNLYSACFCYFVCLLAAAVACNVLSAVHEPAYDKDVILILGCKIRADGTLYPVVRSRVDRAIAFARKQLEASGKQALFLPTGGKGTDEICSEGEAMHRYLLKQGIDENNILVESKSINTRENLLLSRALLNGRDKNAKIAFSTSDFHVFRSGILARQLGWDLDGMGSPTKWYFWPNAFLREFVAIIVNKLKLHILMIAILCVIAFSLSLVLGI